MNYYIIFATAMLVTSSVMFAFRAIRARVIAGRARILKVCVSSALIYQLVFCAAFVVFGINRLAESEKDLRAMRQYEMILSAANYGNENGYQLAAMKTEPQSSTQNTERIERILNNIKILKERSRVLKQLAAFLFLGAFSDLVIAATAFWYITEAGVVMVNFKAPEPFYAVLNGNKIEISYMARLVNSTKVKSFKATPKNLEIFGRFMVQEYQQYPQYPAYPQNPQYPQYQQLPQAAQIPPDQQNPQDPNHMT